MKLFDQSQLRQELASRQLPKLTDEEIIAELKRRERFEPVIVAACVVAIVGLFGFAYLVHVVATRMGY